MVYLTIYNPGKTNNKFETHFSLFQSQIKGTKDLKFGPRVTQGRRKLSNIGGVTPFMTQFF